jgi:hypothetical protein
MTGPAATPTDRRATADAGWIAALGFTPRKESWVAASADRFYKIFRRGDDPVRDWLDPACTEKARQEFADMQRMHRIDERACGPLQRDHACVVYPCLSGPDLRTLLLGRAPGGGARTAAMHDAMSLLARLHAATDSAAHYPLKDYLVDGFLNPDPDVLRRIGGCRRTLCIEGFEVRNFRYDRRRRAWLFFDPQVVSRGVPENDVARFVVSLLMVTWGKGGSPRIWKHFDFGDLVSTYERAASRSVDPVLLKYFLHETIAMRRYFAEKALRGMRGMSRLLGRPYLSAYFLQLEKWAEGI